MNASTSHQAAPANSTDRPLGIRPAVVGRAMGVWVLLAAVAIANGILREAIITPRVGDAAAHVLGTGTAIVAFLAVLAGYLVRSPVEHTDRELLAVGGLWTSLTVVFEFGFGHYVMGHPWSRLLADYNLLAGRVWVMVLVTLLVGPLLVGRWLRNRGSSSID